jgi:hypothetical protein
MEKKCSAWLLVILSSFTLTAQVPVRLEPRHKVALENEWVRLLDVRLPPGDTSLFHIHEIPSFFIPLSTTAVGIEVKGQLPAESKFTLGANWFNGFEKGPLIHKVWNSDTNTLHIIDLEVLSTKKSPLPATVQLPDAKIDFENEKLRAYKVEVSSGKQVTLPNLSTPMILISLSGTPLQIENASKKNTELDAGGFQWLEAGHRFTINSKETTPSTVILILLK